MITSYGRGWNGMKEDERMKEYKREEKGWNSMLEDMRGWHWSWWWSILSDWWWWWCDDADVDEESNAIA